MSEVIRAAAKKWFYESFDCDLLEKMQKAGLIAQAEGFSISVMAELELEMESAFQSQLAALREELVTSRAAYKEQLRGVNYKRGQLRLERDSLQQRLADAERRNVELLEMLHMAWDADHVSAENCRRIDAALNPKPEAASHDE